MKQTNYGFSKVLDLDFEQAIEKVTAELQEEGFGILTEIDVRATLKTKLDMDFTDYCILGACNPTFALKALQAEEQIGLLLPCNVIVYVNADGETVVSAIDPATAMATVDNPQVAEVAAQIGKKLEKFIASV